MITAQWITKHMVITTGAIVLDVHMNISLTLILGLFNRRMKKLKFPIPSPLKF